MRAMLWTIILAFAAWSGWWWFASSTARTATEAAFVEARAAGWLAGHGGIGIAGYPNRVDLTITTPELTEPEGRWGWKAPFVQLFALTYKPWHLIAAFAPEQALSTPLGPMTLTAGKLQSSLVLEPGADLTLERSQLVGEAVSLTGAFGSLSAQSLSFATRPAVAAINAHDIGLELQGITLPAALAARLPADLFAPGTARLHLDAEAGFSSPINRHAAQTRPEITRISLRDASLSWGAARLSVTGTMIPDALGRAEGTLSLEIAGGREMVEAAAALGLLPGDMQRSIELMLAANGTGRPLTLPLTLKDGRLRIGPFVVAEAPLLR